VIKGWFLVPIVFVAMAGNIFGSGNIKKIYAAYFFSAAGVAAISLVFLFFGRLTFDGRLEVFFNSPNYLAMYLAPGLIFGISLAQSQKSKAKIDYLFLVIIAVSLYFTYSYAAWLAAVVSLVVVFILTRRTKRRGWLMGAIILFGLAIFFQADSNKFAGLMNPNGSSSLDSRIVIWRAAGKIIQDNWFWGIGPDNFQAVYLDYQKYFPPYPEWAVPHPHNVFLAFWLSGGALGLMGFLGLLYFYFQKIVRRLKEAGQDPIKRMIAAASCGVMIYILFHGIFDATYFKNDLAVVFWLAFLALL
jgi:O-antigen ligase